ncbi:hypothetical protein BC332_27514 [Capsicum chinense]|nr:hypothetical protein BC332_27514 [Capsicum chinense]
MGCTAKLSGLDQQNSDHNSSRYPNFSFCWATKDRHSDQKGLLVFPSRTYWFDRILGERDLLCVIPITSHLQQEVELSLFLLVWNLSGLIHDPQVNNSNLTPFCSSEIGFETSQRWVLSLDLGQSVLCALFWISFSLYRVGFIAIEDSATENEERAGSYWRILFYNMKCKEKTLYRSRTLPPDMLSNFPENVIDKILMCLPFRDSVRTSILSKKWRYVWRRLPEFMLSHTSWKPKEDLADLTSNFRKIIDRILAFHFGPVTKFTLSIPYFDTCPFIDDLIRFLSRNDIQHLVLRLPIRGKPYELPPSLFTCSQLRHLTLPNCLIPHQPAFKEFDRSISLELRDVTMSS